VACPRLKSSPTLTTATRIFVSYRRDASFYAARLADGLESQFSKGWVFRDDRIPKGANFKREIERHLHSCDVLIAVIDPQWVVDANGRKRLDDPGDFVRLEIATAFDRSVHVLPVLVGGAKKPEAAELPKMLRKLAALEWSALHDEGWDRRVGKLIKRIERQLKDADLRREDALVLRTRAAYPPLEWRCVVRGGQAAVYEMIGDLMTNLFPTTARRGHLLGKPSEEIILTRMKYSQASVQELVVSLTPLASEERTEVLIRADAGYRRQLQKLARKVLDTRRVEFPD
jgi:hypothetical protein